MLETFVIVMITGLTGTGILKQLLLFFFFFRSKPTYLALVFNCVWNLPSLTLVASHSVL